MLRRLPLVLLLCAGAAAPAPAPDPLASRVTIYRDEYGVPHIAGDSEEAAFFGYGFAQAEDHLERMMLQFRDAQGRRAEVQGFKALGDRYLQFIPYEYRWDGDYLQRLLRTKKGVLENRDKMDPQVRRVLDAFARGVNEYIAEHRREIPAWIDSITAEDVEALERSQYLRFYSIHDALSKLTDPPYQFPNFGSNQWAIAPSKSANGRIIHVEHTHMPWANRFQNYEAHLMVPGKLNAGGISWFGSPFFLDGFNDKITWSATWNEPNMADVYEEKLNPENLHQYSYEGQWRDIRKETETFRVKGPSGIESITLPTYYTHHGPVVKIDREKHRAWSVKLPNFDGVNYSLGLYGLMKARNLAEFKAHVSRQLMPRWNLLYSDARDICWVHNGNVARRADGYDWTKPVPGWIKETEWGPYIPFEQYPQILNPASGFLQNCNNPPWVVTKNSGLKPLEPVPYFLKSKPKADAGEEALNTRGERIFQVLGQDRKFTLEEMTDLGFDTYVMPADVIVPLLERAARGATEPKLKRALQTIAAWNRRSAADSVAYTYLYFWGKAYEKSNSRQFRRFLSYTRSKIDLDSPEEQKLALDALRESIETIEKRFGKSEVRWGEVNVVVRGGTFAMDGEPLYGVLHPDEGVEQDNGQLHCDDGWGHLLVVMEGEPKQIWSLLPYGQSEHATSPHYNDHAKLHSQRQAKRFWFTPAEILEHAESVRGDRNRIKSVQAP
jgi:acyl-homoserine lactone acylase PvdQ